MPDQMSSKIIKALKNHTYCTFIHFISRWSKWGFNFIARKL